MEFSCVINATCSCCAMPCLCSSGLYTVWTEIWKLVQWIHFSFLPYNILYQLTSALFFYCFFFIAPFVFCHGGCRFSKVFQTSLYQAMFSGSSWGDPEALTSKERRIISPVCSGCTLGSLAVGQEILLWKAPRRHSDAWTTKEKLLYSFSECRSIQHAKLADKDDLNRPVK